MYLTSAYSDVSTLCTSSSSVPFVVAFCYVISYVVRSDGRLLVAHAEFSRVEHGLHEQHVINALLRTGV